MSNYVFCGGAAWYFWPTRFILVEQANFGDKGTANAVPAEIPSGILLYEVDQLRFYNRNQYDLYLWGNKFADLNTPIEKEARIIPVGAYYYFLTDKLEANALRVIGTDGDQIVPFEIYFSTPSKLHYTAKFYLLIKMKKGAMSVHTQQLGISEGGW